MSSIPPGRHPKGRQGLVPASRVGIRDAKPSSHPVSAPGLRARSGTTLLAVRVLRANAMRMSTRMRESRDPALERQPVIVCCASGDPSVRSVIGVRPSHFRGADPLRGKSFTEEGEPRALLDAWGSVGTRARLETWGIRRRTVPGVLLRSGLRGPGPPALEGGDARPDRRWGPASSAVFPPLSEAPG